MLLKMRTAKDQRVIYSDLEKCTRDLDAERRQRDKLKQILAYAERSQVEQARSVSNSWLRGTRLRIQRLSAKKSRLQSQLSRG